MILSKGVVSEAFSLLSILSNSIGFAVILWGVFSGILKSYASADPFHILRLYIWRTWHHIRNRKNLRMLLLTIINLKMHFAYSVIFQILIAIFRTTSIMCRHFKNYHMAELNLCSFFLSFSLLLKFTYRSQ